MANNDEKVVHITGNRWGIIFIISFIFVLGEGAIIDPILDANE